MAYEALMLRYPHLVIKEVSGMPKGLSGLYYDNIVLLDKNKTKYEKHCLLAEELGHYETTYGDITNLKDIRNLKLEKFARKWAFEAVVSLDRIVECYELGLRTAEEICLHLEIVPAFLNDAIGHYAIKYGLCTVHKDYKICFDPLNIEKLK